MERVLLNKVAWLNNAGHEVVIVTTDQQQRPMFYNFPKGVRIIDLGINYSVDNNKPLYKRIPLYLRKRNAHKRCLSEFLMQERPDITISLYPSESSFIPDINDGSKKVLELHFNRFFRQQYGRNGLLGLIDRYRCRQDEKIARRFDRFIVLTEEDKGYWGNMQNISVIPNAAKPMPVKSDCDKKRVIAVGRLDYQKGFDRLIEVWDFVKKSPLSEGWQLDIFGQGEWQDKLCNMIESKRLTDSANINAPTDNIAQEYATSSILVMTSNYEGFPMVMIEAMSAGLPVVTFDYKCGPADIIQSGVNGIIVPDGENETFAKVLLNLMSDDKLRKQMGREATKVTTTYSEAEIMKKWMALFEEVINN